MTKRRARHFLLASAATSVVMAAVPALAQETSQGTSAAASLGASSDAAGAPGAVTLGPAAPTLPPNEDTGLPRAGIDPNIADLRDHLLNTYGQAPASPTGPAPPNLQILPQIGLAEEWTSNAGALAGGGAGGFGNSVGSDFVTFIQPAITIIDTSQRLEVNLTYQPVGEIYAQHSGFSQFEEEGSGDILATILPGWLYLDLRGSISQQSVFGGSGPASTVTLSPNERETVSSVSISPYVTHTFGGTGTLQAGVGYSYSATDAPNYGNVTVPTNQGNIQLNQYLRESGLYGSSSLGTERAFASFTTGENYGRLRDRLGVDASFYTGNGAAGGGRRVLVTDDASYAINRWLTVLAQIGYESLDYPNAGYRYSGPIGYGGVQLTPTRGTSLTLEYRYVDGFGSIFAQGSWQATPRLRVYGGYSEGIATFDQDLQNSLLDTADENVTGVAASGLIAAPLLAGSNFFGANQNLSKLKRANIAATWLGNWDVVTLAADYETTTPVGRSLFGFVPASTEGEFISVSERHELSETLALTGFIQYGRSRSGLLYSGTADSISVSAGIEKSFNRGLSAYARFGGSYYLSGNTFGAFGQSGNVSSVIVGGLKRF